MFKKILVPVDLTEKNHRAVETARRLLDIGGQMTLLHVIATIEDAAYEELEEFYARLEAKAEAELATLSELGAGEGIAIYRRVVYGRRAQEIVRYAEETGSDLIALSSHAMDREQPTEHWATVSYRVAILATCPVLLVK